MKSTEEILSNLSQFTGTEHYYKHWLGGNYTDGIKYLAELTECFWLLDLCFSVQPQLRHEEFQVITLNVHDTKGTVVVDDGNGRILLPTQQIEFTDFPLPYIKLYMANGILLLPSEY